MKVFYCLILIGFLNSPHDVHAQKYQGDPTEIQALLEQMKLFSSYLVAGDTDNLVACYTSDAKLFPDKREILESPEAIRQYWTPSDRYSTTYHKLTSEEIKIWGDEAYDYGYYEGTTEFNDGRTSNWKGKYVIVWRKLGEDWKIYLDIWNRVTD